ncbi:hypothetical protein MLD38_015294 [Melastoma candidum]|uniref:Uncharacterized protein n=1 Tax=Melastoma candidum TaxID=119954 RepID=A0ACB9RFS2_9MYRT|nr:hypothetical protein MLD38_015294 [Melastoma candidum]
MNTAPDPPPPRKRKTRVMPVPSQPLGITASAEETGGVPPETISLLRSEVLKDRPLPTLESDALRWKQKAKDRKLEILRLREDLKLVEEASRSEGFSQVAACKCYFFDDLGKPIDVSNDDSRFSDVLRRRFFRQVRYQESLRQSDNSCLRHHLLGVGSIDEVEKLSSAVDFLMKLCDTVSSVGNVHFANWSHQAVDFMLALLKNILRTGENLESTEGIVDRLILGLVRRIISLGEDDAESISRDQQFNIQHLIRKLGSEPYFGLRALLAVSQKVHLTAESLLFADPFDEKFPIMHQSMYILIQLLELLICDYLLAWSKAESFDHLMFEEWLASIVHARRAVGLLESRNSLYMLYMDRLVGELARLLGQVPSFCNLNPETLSKLFH